MWKNSHHPLSYPIEVCRELLLSGTKRALVFPDAGPPRVASLSVIRNFLSDQRSGLENSPPDGTSLMPRAVPPGAIRFTFDSFPVCVQENTNGWLNINKKYNCPSMIKTM
jgi:hypothetical protein